MMVDIRDESLSEATAFLERSPEASLLLLSKLREFGPRLGPSTYSGNFQGIWEDGKLVAVFCLTAGGNLHVQSGDRTDLARAIVDATKPEGIPIRAVLGEWQSSKPVWDLLRADGCLGETVAWKEVLYRLNLTESAVPVTSVADVRMLTGHDHDRWEPICAAFQRETGEPPRGSREERKALFDRSAALGRWWGAFEHGQLVSMAAVIALHARIAQIGGVFTIPERRRLGISRAVMARLILDARDVHRLARLCLFTSEGNTPARQLYESLGFEHCGHFGWFL